MINYLKFELRNRKPCKQRTLVPDFDRFQTMRGDTDTDLVFLQARGRGGRLALLLYLLPPMHL